MKKILGILYFCCLVVSVLWLMGIDNVYSGAIKMHNLSLHKKYFTPQNIGEFVGSIIYTIAAALIIIFFTISNVFMFLIWPMEFFFGNKNGQK